MSVAVDPRLNEAVIPPIVLAGLVEIAQREGCSIVSWFSGTGLDAAALLTADVVLMSFQQTATILRRALRAMPGRPLGMQVGGRDALLSFGMLGVAVRSCSNTREALAVVLELHQASGSLLDVEVEMFGAEAALRLHERAPDPQLVAFLCEEAFCSTMVLVHSILGPDWLPTRIELTYPEPGYTQEYRRFFRCPVRFGAEANRLVFPTALLDYSFPTHHELNRITAVDACRRLLDLESSRPDIPVAIETLLDRHLRHALTMAEVAERLHITERTLRRQLAAAGDSFSAVRDRVRARRATFLLRESKMKIEAIAHEVGFSDAREFRRACIRWTGQPPSDIRRAL